MQILLTLLAKFADVLDCVICYTIAWVSTLAFAPFGSVQPLLLDIGFASASLLNFLKVLLIGRSLSSKCEFNNDVRHFFGSISRET